MKIFNKALTVILTISAALFLVGCDVYAMRALEADAAADRHSNAGDGGGGGHSH